MNEVFRNTPVPSLVLTLCQIHTARYMFVLALAVNDLYPPPPRSILHINTTSNPCRPHAYPSRFMFVLAMAMNDLSSVTHPAVPSLILTLRPGIQGYDHAYDEPRSSTLEPRSANLEPRSSSVDPYYTELLSSPAYSNFQPKLDHIDPASEVYVLQTSM